MAGTEPPIGASPPESVTQPAPRTPPEPQAEPMPVLEAGPAAPTGLEAATESAPSTPEPASKPEAFAVSTASMELAGQEQRVDVYRPAVVPSTGAAIVAHGFGRSRVRHRDLGRALAAAGITAVIPDLPQLLNIWLNGDAIVELAHKLEAGALGLAPVERGRLVLIGTSAGGLASVLAAAELPGLAGWIGLDPVDRTGTGAEAAAKMTAPAVVLLGAPSGCNLIGSGRVIARAVPGLRRAPVFADASHCDFEDPTNKFCQVLCGSSSAAMQERIRGEVVKAATEFLPRRADRPTDALVDPE